MGLSRRTFTREFEPAAARRLEAGASLAQVSRGLEVSPNALHRWRCKFRQAHGNASPGRGQRCWPEVGVVDPEKVAFRIDYLPVNSLATSVIASHASVRNGAAGRPAALNRLQPMG